MRHLTSTLLISIVLASTAAAAPFDPKVSDVCAATPAAAGARGKVDTRRLLGALLKSQGIYEFDLDTSGGDATFETKIKAVTNFNTFCNAPGRCSQGTATKLSNAAIALIDFLRRNARVVPAGQAGFEVTSSVSGLDQPRLTAFLRGAPGAFQVVCVAGATAPAAPIGEAEAQIKSIVSSIAVRKNIEDLTIPSSSKKFQSLDRATISYTDDRIKGTRTLATAGVAGYQLPASLLGEYASTILFADYSGNRVWADNPKNNQNIGNFGTGVLGNFDVPLFGYFQNVNLFGHYVHSHVTDSDLFAGKMTITPDLPIPGVGIAFNPNDGPLAFLLKPQLKLVYGSVLNAGSNPLLIDTHDYARGGGKIAFWIFGVDGIFRNFTFNASYESLKVWRGPLDTISRFESTLSYTLGDQDNWAVELKYVNGRNVDTLEREQIVKLGLGYKQ